RGPELQLDPLSVFRMNHIQPALTKSLSFRLTCEFRPQPIIHGAGAALIRRPDHDWSMISHRPEASLAFMERVHQVAKFRDIGDHTDNHLLVPLGTREQ